MKTVTTAIGYAKFRSRSHDAVIRVFDECWQISGAMSDKKEWRTYEQVAQYLLERFACHFGLGRVEGKQLVPGASGTNWEIEAKGIKIGGEGIVLIECRRHTKAKLSQEQLGALAFRIKDTGAQGGIIVSPLELQKGAKLVAAHENITQVILDAKSTTIEYVMKFLNNIFVGLSAELSFKSSLKMDLIKEGKIVETRNDED